jgi:hypothetical protein
MRVMSQSPDPLARMHTMTKRQGKSGTIVVKAVLAEDEEFLRALVRTALQEVLEAEMTEAVGAVPRVTPTAPSISCAAIPRPSKMPPEATMGIGDTASTTCGTSAIVLTSPQ